MVNPPLRERLPESCDCSSDDLLGRFLDYTTERQLELYPAQEEAILALFENRNVILNTPTGSGKSLVAAAAHFKSVARGRRSVYTCPIKALVNEKFLALCRDFGPENVGLATGDATVNRDAPILCCTAEILANYALALGAEAPFHEVIMDEFHFYADESRGVAWQVPILTMRKSQFLLLSATLGSTDFFQRELTRLTSVETVVVASGRRPVPLEFSYVESSLDVTVQELVESKKAPVYVVHFSQNEAAQSAQDLMSVNYCNTMEKAALAEALVGARFTSPYGKEVKKYLRHGIGIHHAGLLPKYRVLVEQLAQRGLLKIICGTDTLGVGVNVPIRTVLLTKLSKFNGQKVATLTARDFHQISGRAGRKGFDDIGYVVGMAPEHVIENAKMEAKAAGDPKKMKKMVKRKPPEGFVGWSEETFKKLQASPPEPLASRFQVSSGMLLQVLSRPHDGCRAMQRLIRDSHESLRAKTQHTKRAWQLFRSLVERNIVCILPSTEREDGAKLRLNVDLQEDFSLHHALSLYLIDALALLDAESPSYPLAVMSLIEAILEDPDIILRRQLDKVKSEKLAEMKADGVPYEERMAELEALEHPKPNRDFIYATFNEFAASHPWVGQENIHPKSIVREMYENFQSFASYVQEYDLHRVEGVLLRHLSGACKVLTQTVPVWRKTPAVLEMEEWLTGLLRGADSSLLDEWERMRDPNWRPSESEVDSDTPPRPSDVTRNRREFTALIRGEIFRVLQALASRDYTRAAVLLREGSEISRAWTAEKLSSMLAPFHEARERLRLDPEARNGRHTHVREAEDQKSLVISQVLVDPDEYNDWEITFRVNLDSAREEGRPILELLTVCAIGATPES